ncbi:hypothetical protein K8R04_01230 [Candidatus Uhrbacteria bacterium]|nr:hypothetical protein [Candidatus Uhrbacteria bacterium]
MNLLKKLFSSFVALTTIAWSVGIGSLALPSMASAAFPGQLIKASGPAVYYFASDMKRYVFPNEKTYFSWYMNFNSVQTISDSELASYPIGGNVTIRPGTNLVKITTDPKVYAVSPNGVLHWVESEALAIALYGASWASRVVDVPDGFFVNYSVGSSISSAVHPDGTVIMYSGDPSKYVVWGGMKRKVVNDSVYNLNGFNPIYIITTTISYPNGMDVTGREDALANVINPGTTVVGGAVTVALASDTPAGQNVPQGASSIQLAKYNLTAGSAGVMISGLTLRRVGVGASSDFANVYLYKGDGTRLTTGRTINSSTNLVQFNGLNISIGAGQTYSVLLVGDTNTSLTAGGQHSFEISDAASVVVSGTGSSVTGSFPVRGNVFTIGTTTASRLDVQKGTTPTNPQIGAAEVEISNFKLVAQGNDIEVRRVTLLQAGSVSNTDITNLKLYQGATVVATASALVGDKIVLNFSPAYLITDGTTRVFSLKAAVAGRSARTIKTYVEYSTDVYAIDTEFGTGARVCIDATSPCNGSFDGNSTNYIEVTTEGGQFTTTFNGPATADIAKGSQDVPLFKFAVTASDSLLEVRKMYFTLTGLTSADKVKGTSGTEYFRDLKIKNLDTGTTLMGPISLPSATASPAQTSGVMTFTDSFNVAAGQTLNLAFTADLTNSADDVANEFSADGNNQYRAIMANGSSALFGSSDIRIVDTGEFLPVAEIVPNSTINGNPMTVKASSLSISLAASPTAGTAVKNEANIASAGFVFTAGSQSQLLIRTVKLTGRADVATTGTFALADLNDAVTSCALFDGLTQVGNSESPDGTTGAMNITNVNVTVPAGTSKTLVAKCTADSIVASQEDKFAIGIASTADVTADDQDSNSITPTLSTAVTDNAGATPGLKQTIKAGGTLTIATDNLRQSTILVAGGDVWQNFAQFKATAQFEAMNLTRLNATSTGDAANFTAIAVAKDGVVVGSDVLPAGGLQNRDIDLTGAPIMVPKDGSVVFQFWGKIGNVQASSSVSGATTGVVRSGNQAALGLGANLQTGNWDASYSGMFNVRAVGLASGDVVRTAGTATVGNPFVIRKSKPTVTRQSLSTTTLSDGSSQDLYRMQVSADSAGSVAIKKISFDFSKTGTVILTNFRVRKGSTDLNLADYSVVDANGTDIEAGSLVTGTSTGRVIVNFTNEETVTGSGNVYTLYATPSATAAGNTVSFAPTRNLSGTIVTGYLDTETVAGTQLTNATFSMPGANLDTASSPDGTADAAGTFVWSDLSEVPHGFASPGSSFDWTNDVFVEDMTQTQTLTR